MYSSWVCVGGKYMSPVFGFTVVCIVHV